MPTNPCVLAAEAFTGWGIRWDEDFKRLQDTANRHFARGVTHLAYQSYTHAPSPTATPPGGCMGGFNGTPFTRLQTWWRYMPEFNGYITRCEEFLEAGLPAQDVLWYLGDAVDHKPDEDYPFPEGFRADCTDESACREGWSFLHPGRDDVESAVGAGRAAYATGDAGGVEAVV